jgi:hypothetical protein
MKKIYFLLTSFTALLNIQLAAQQTTFTKVIDFIGRPSIAQAFDNGYMITGNDYLSSYLVKTDEQGAILWSREYHNINSVSTPAIWFNALVPTFDSCFVIAGQVINNTTTYQDALLMKLNAQGDTLWSKVMSNPTHYLEVLSVQQTNDSGYVISGHSPWGQGEFNGVFISKLDAEGDLQWSMILNNGNSTHYGYCVKQTADNGFIVTGFYTIGSPYEEYAFLAKLSPAGTLEWAKRYNYATPLFCFGNDVIELNDGYLCYLNAGEHTALMKTDLQGNEVWTKQYIYTGTNNTIQSRSRGLYRTSDTTYVFISGSDYSGSLTTVDTSGNVVWTKNLMLSAVDGLHTADNGYLVIGYGPWIGVMQTPEHGPDPRSSSAGSGSQVGLIKTDSIGNSISCVQDQVLTVSNEHMLSVGISFATETGCVINAFHPVVLAASLSQRDACIDFSGSLNEEELDMLTLYPTPAINIITIETSNKGNYTLHDITGKTLLQGTASAPKFTLDISTFSSGVYFISVSDGERQVNGKVVKE